VAPNVPSITICTRARHMINQHAGGLKPMEGSYPSHRLIIYAVAITNRARRSQITSGEPRVRMRGARASNADPASREDGARGLATATAPARRRRDELAPRIGSGGVVLGVMMPRAKRVACGARTHIERHRKSTTRPAHSVDRVQAHHLFC
jgi:hypothetical protein